MGDSACLVHGFSYASAMPTESNQNIMHALGDSISFGRFMTESLSWERWSTFSHKKYVEEAERYAQPGLVAQKKAFFEAQYKRIAANKAAAPLEQENADNKAKDEHQVVLNSHSDVCDVAMEAKIQDAVEANDQSSMAVVETGGEGQLSVMKNPVNQLDNFEKQDEVSASEASGTPKTEGPLIKNSVVSEDIPSAASKKTSGLSSMRTSIQRKTWKVTSAAAKPVIVDSMDTKISSSKSLSSLMNLVPIKKHDKELISATGSISGLASSSCMTPKDGITLLRTPIVMPPSKGMSTYPAATPPSERRRMEAPFDPSAPGTKATGPKWQVLSAVCSKTLTAFRNKLQSPTLSTPFILTTEERDTKRKQKLEEKFNADEVQKMQLQKSFKEKAGNKFRKLGCGFCFGARSLPDFYEEEEITKNKVKKTPAAAPQSVVLASSDKMMQGTISMPPSTPTRLAKNNASKNSSRRRLWTQPISLLNH